jgi:hypothetical protein
LAYCANALIDCVNLGDFRTFGPTDAQLAHAIPQVRVFALYGIEVSLRRNVGGVGPKDLFGGPIGDEELLLVVCEPSQVELRHVVVFAWSALGLNHYPQPSSFAFRWHDRLSTWQLTNRRNILSLQNLPDVQLEFDW